MDVLPVSECVRASNTAQTSAHHICYDLQDTKYSFGTIFSVSRSLVDPVRFKHPWTSASAHISDDKRCAAVHR